MTCSFVSSVVRPIKSFNECVKKCVELYLDINVELCMMAPPT